MGEFGTNLSFAFTRMKCFSGGSITDRLVERCFFLEGVTGYDSAFGSEIELDGSFGSEIEYMLSVIVLMGLGLMK